MQRALEPFGVMALPTGGTVALTAKVAIATGMARRFVVGRPESQLFDVLAGETVSRMAAGEHLAEKGEVLIYDNGTVASRLKIAEERVDIDSGSSFLVVNGINDASAPSEWPSPHGVGLTPETVRQWLQEPVFDRLSTGREEYLAELRPAVALFLSFEGIDYERDPDAPSKLNTYVCQVQATLDRFGGHLIQLTVGDKGSYLYGSFGALVAHDDDATRAVNAALDILAKGRTLEFVTICRAGVTAGRVFCGAYGSSTCRTFGVQGDSVNLAARLMQAASPGTALVSSRVFESSRASFNWEELIPIRVKGKSEPVSVFRPLGAATRTGQESRPVSGNPRIVGRRAELASIARLIEEVVSGQRRIVGIEAEAGMGKSRLVAEVVRMWRAHGHKLHEGVCESYAVNDSYHVWRSALRSFFGLTEETNLEQQAASLHQYLADVDKDLTSRMPLLGAVLNLPIVDSPVTRSLDGMLRKQSLESLVVECFRHQARLGPLLFVLEDCHWIDPLSRDLLEAVARGVAGLPIMILLAYRPGHGDHPSLDGVTNLSGSYVMGLASLEAAEAAELLQQKISEVFGGDTAPSASLIERVAALAQGNPFYVEELIHYVREQGLQISDERAAELLDLPQSLDRLILGRIDALSQTEKVTVKVASVVGRQFPKPWLRGADPDIGPEEQVSNDLDSLARLDLTLKDQSEPEPVYLFKHMLTRDVAYGSVPFALRTKLHGQLAEYVEVSYDESLSGYVDLLAYHYDFSSRLDKRRHYLRLAGIRAQEVFANESAADYYRKLQTLNDGPESAEVFHRLGQVLDLTGDWEGAATSYRSALSISDNAGNMQLSAAIRRAIGWLFRKQGRYDEAVNWLLTARSGFEDVGDRASQSQVTTELGEIARQSGEFGRAKECYDQALALAESAPEPQERMVSQAQALKGAGTLAAQQGDLSAAKPLYEQSVALRRQLDDRPGIGALLSNLGVLAYYSGDHQSARELDEESLALFRQIGDQWSAATLLNNLGDIERDAGNLPRARELLAESLEVRRRLGDSGGIAFSLNSLGDILLDEGATDEALPLLTESLILNSSIGDRGAVAYLLDDMACIIAAAGPPATALRLSGAADAERERIGSQIAPGEKERFDRLLAPAVRKLGAKLAEDWVTSGRSLSMDEAIKLALETTGDLEHFESA